MGRRYLRSLAALAAFAWALAGPAPILFLAAIGAAVTLEIATR